MDKPPSNFADGAKQRKAEGVPQREKAAPINRFKELSRQYDAQARESAARYFWRQRGELAKQRLDFAEDSMLKQKQRELYQNNLVRESLEMPGFTEYVESKAESDPRFYATFLGLLQVDLDIKGVTESLQLVLRKRKQRFFFNFSLFLLTRNYEQKLREFKKRKQDLEAERQTAYELVKRDYAERVKEYGVYLSEEIEELEKGHSLVLSKRRAELVSSLKKMQQDFLSSAKNTQESLETGDLAIKKLAIKNNAIVVHAIPLDIWKMNGTAGNNDQINSTNIGAEDKINIVQQAAPDLSASVLSTGQAIQGMMYPMGVVLDGEVIASYAKDMTTKTSGKQRIVPWGTLQKDPVSAFTETAKTPTQTTNMSESFWNECIVRNPKIVGFVIDEAIDSLRLPIFNNGVEEVLVNENDEEQEKIVKRDLAGRHKDKKKLEIFTTHSSDSVRGFGNKYVVASWEQDSVALAKEYVMERYSAYPLYFRKADGLYDKDGNKVSAADIYK